jgi:hypothetical protein
MSASGWSQTCSTEANSGTHIYEDYYGCAGSDANVQPGDSAKSKEDQVQRGEDGTALHFTTPPHKKTFRAFPPSPSLYAPFFGPRFYQSVISSQDCDSKASSQSHTP